MRITRILVLTIIVSFFSNAILSLQFLSTWFHLPFFEHSCWHWSKYTCTMILNGDRKWLPWSVGLVTMHFPSNDLPSSTYTNCGEVMVLHSEVVLYKCYDPTKHGYSQNHEIVIEGNCFWLYLSIAKDLGVCKSCSSKKGIDSLHWLKVLFARKTDSG